MDKFEDILQYALWHGDLDQVLKLSSADPKRFEASIRQPGFRQNTVLFFVARVPTRQGHGDAALLEEAREPERVQLVDLLVTSGADVNARNHRKVTPLHMAARYGLSLVTGALLRQGAIVDVQDVNHETPLYRAANLGHAEVVQVLLEHGANVDLPDRLGQRPLDRAIAKGSSHIKELLLAYGAKETSTDKPLIASAKKPAAKPR